MRRCGGATLARIQRRDQQMAAQEFGKYSVAASSYDGNQNAKAFTTVRNGRLFSDGQHDISTNAHSRHLNTAQFEKRNMTIPVLSDGNLNQNMDRTLVMNQVRGKHGLFSQDGYRQSSKAGEYAITVEHNRSIGPRSVRAGGVTLKDPLTTLETPLQSNMM